MMFDDGIHDTSRLALPLLQPAQAQKHVTVNESLSRLDGMVNMVLQSVDRAVPPEVVIDGQCWGLPAGAGGRWEGMAGQIAIGSNNGWSFLRPAVGMRAFVADRGMQAIYSGDRWVIGAVALSGTGSGMCVGGAEARVLVAAGAQFETGLVIPSHAMVIGAVARVNSALTGSLRTWRLGVAGFDDRFGRGLGIAAGSWARGMLGAPVTHYEPRPLLMTAEGGLFEGGEVTLAAYWWTLRVPDEQSIPGQP